MRPGKFTFIFKASGHLSTKCYTNSCIDRVWLKTQLAKILQVIILSMFSPFLLKIPTSTLAKISSTEQQPSMYLCMCVYPLQWFLHRTLGYYSMVSLLGGVTYINCCLPVRRFRVHCKERTKNNI